jgi:hypothetical protein
VGVLSSFGTANRIAALVFVALISGGILAANSPAAAEEAAPLLLVLGT